MSSSRTLSKVAESDPPGAHDRERLREVAPEELRGELRLAGAHPVDVAACSVLISPLCAMTRNGWASSQLGKVFVEKREWTRARRAREALVLEVGVEPAQLVGMSIPL